MRRWCNTVVASAAVLAASAGFSRGACAAAPASAAEPPLPSQRAGHVGIDAALTASPHGPTVSTLGAALRLSAEYRFASGLGLSLAGGTSSVSLDVEGQRSRSGTFPGNVLLGVRLERAPFPGLQLGASLRAGAPLALYPGGIDDNRLAELAYAMAAAAQGFVEPFLWQPNVVPVVLGAQATLRTVDWLTMRAQLAPAHLISVNQRPSRWAIATQLDAAAAFRPFLAHVGLNHFASTLPLENRDRAQLALRAGAGALLDEQRVLLDVSMGLDDPYGAFQSAPHPWWGVSIVVESSFGTAIPASRSRP